MVDTTKTGDEKKEDIYYKDGRLTIEGFKRVKARLDFLFYKMGNQCDDFRVSVLVRNEDGSTFSTKWKKYSEIIFPIDYNEAWKLGNINNRETLKNEIVIDLESKDILPMALSLLKRWKWNYEVFSTGSRGYHIHIFFQEKVTEELMEKVRKKLFLPLNADTQKIYNKAPIALEYSLHWKSRKPKELVEENA